MKIDFDNYRKQTVKDFNALVDKIQSCSQRARDVVEVAQGDILMGQADIEEQINDLRNKVVTLCCIEIEGEGIKSIIDDVKIKSYGDYI